MILLAALALAAAPAPPEEDIVVVARRVAAAQLTLGRDARGRNTCGLSRSSGDPRIDAALCRRAARCLGRGSVESARTRACVDKRKDRLLADWRRGART